MLFYLTLSSLFFLSILVEFAKSQKPVVSVPYIHTVDHPIKGRELGAAKVLYCKTHTCKILCEEPGECYGLTVIADSSIDKLLIECSQEGCLNMKVHTNALSNVFKCRDRGACSSAKFVCGVKSLSNLGKEFKMQIPSIPVRAIDTCFAECTNGGCAKYHNPTYPQLQKLKGTTLVCNDPVMQCDLHADSSNSGFNRAMFFNSKLQSGLQFTPQGSFDSGTLICNVKSIGLQNKPMFGFGFVQQMPRCELKCSSSMHKRYCGGANYLCKTNAMQCQCLDYCTQHPTECLRDRISKDCPRLSFPPKKKVPVKKVPAVKKP